MVRLHDHLVDQPWPARRTVLLGLNASQILTARTMAVPACGGPAPAVG